MRLTPEPLPARYIWHTAIGAANFDCKANDPSGQANLGNNHRRPAIGFVVGNAGAVLYQDSRGVNVWMAQCNAGQYYPADVAQILYTGTVTPAETGTPTGTLTPTAFKIVLYWDA
jgi:hypothetical protein